MIPATIAFIAAITLVVMKLEKHKPNKIAAKGSKIDERRHHFKASFLLDIINDKRKKTF